MNKEQDKNSPKAHPSVVAIPDRQKCSMLNVMYEVDPNLLLGPVSVV